MQTIEVTSLNDYSPEDIQEVTSSVPKGYCALTGKAVAAALDINDVNDSKVKDTAFAIFNCAYDGESNIKPSVLRKVLRNWMTQQQLIPASEVKQILKGAGWPQKRLRQAIPYALICTTLAAIVFIVSALISSPASNASDTLIINGKSYDAISVDENGKKAKYDLVSAMSDSETVGFHERFNRTYTKPVPAVHYANQAEPGTNNFGPRLAVTTIDDINNRLAEKLVKDPTFLAAVDHASLHREAMSHQQARTDAVTYLDDTKRLDGARKFVDQVNSTAIVNQHGVKYESLGQIPNKDGGLPTLTAFSTQQDMGYALLVNFKDGRLPLLLRIDCDLQPSFPKAFTSVPRYGKKEKVATQAPRPFVPPASMQPPKPKPQVVQITTPKPTPKPKPTPTPKTTTPTPTPTPSNPPKTTPPTPGTPTPSTTTVTTTTTPTPTPSNPPKTTTPPVPSTTTPTTTQPTTTPKTTTPTPTPSDGKKDPEAGPNSQEGHAGNAGKPSEPIDAVVPPIKETDPNVATAPATNVVEPIKDAAPATVAPNNAAENNSTEQNPSNGELANPDAAAPAAAPAAPAPAPAPAPAVPAPAPAAPAPAPAPAAPAMPEQKVEAPATFVPEAAAVAPAPQAPIEQAPAPVGAVEVEAPVVIDNAPAIEPAPEVVVAETPAESVEIELSSKSFDRTPALLYAAIAFALAALASFAYSYKQKRRRTM